MKQRREKLADWTIETLDPSEIHTFERTPVRLPLVRYDQALTEHRLLDGSMKFDKSAGSIVKRVLFAWEWISRTERELLEDYADLVCQVKVTWYDEDNQKHMDTGYMLIGPATGTLSRKYTFGFTLVITSEA